MKTFASVLITLFLVAPVCFVTPAQAVMPETEAQNIVATAYKAVQDTLAALQAANGSGDTEQIDQALKSLNLAVNTYTVAGENLAMLQAGTLQKDATLENCYVLADKLSLFSAQLLQKDFKSAWFFFTESQRLATFLPAPKNSGDMPAGLADLQSQIIAATSEAVSLLRKAGVDGREKKDESGGKLGINTQVGSPI